MITICIASLLLEDWVKETVSENAFFVVVGVVTWTPGAEGAQLSQIVKDSRERGNGISSAARRED